MLKRFVFVVLISGLWIMSVYAPAAAQTDTPTPTPTETSTATPTPNFYIQFTTPSGEAARVERTITAGDIAIFTALVLLVLSGWSWYVSWRLGGD